VDAAIASIELMCAAQANPDTPIKKADLTGIFVPK
jgi:acid stress chaperone HdeA